MSSMSVDEQKATNLQKWKEFQARQAFEQELAAKQAFFGRGGDPTGIRYTGYEGGSDMPEWYTYDVISSYAEGEGLVQQNGEFLFCDSVLNRFIDAGQQTGLLWAWIRLYS